MIMHDGGQMCVKCALVNFYIPSSFSNLHAHSSKNELFADIFRAIGVIQKMAVFDSVYAWKAMILGGVFDGFSELSSTLDSILTTSTLLCGMEPYNSINQVDRINTNYIHCHLLLLNKSPFTIDPEFSSRL
jgi:hypothetical protein